MTENAASKDASLGGLESELGRVQATSARLMQELVLVRGQMSSKLSEFENKFDGISTVLTLYAGKVQELEENLESMEIESLTRSFYADFSTGMESGAEAEQQTPSAERNKVDHEEDEEKMIGKFIRNLNETDAKYYVFRLHNVLGIPCSLRFQKMYLNEFILYAKMRNPVEVTDLGHVKHISHDGISEITVDFSCCIHKLRFGRLFKGEWMGKEVLVKRWDLTFPISDCYAYFPQRFASQLELLLNRDVVKHPKIAKLIGFCCEKILALVWDLKLNPTLHDLVPQDSFTWDQRMKVADQVAETLDFFHNKKIALCNFFPPCISVDEVFNIKLFDLSLSVNLAKEQDYQGIWWRDYKYCSPEAQEVDRAKFPDDFEKEWFYASDVYHFGLLLLELILAKCVDNLVWVWVESGKEAFEKAGTCSSPPHPQVKINIFELAMKCLQRERTLRPKMDEVFLEFRKIVPV